jgi:hypothetical protein
MVATRKVLMLHGFSQNAIIFSKRLRAVRAVMGKDIELVFLDAPHVLKPVDIDGVTANALISSGASSSTPDPTLTPRAWWRMNAELTGAPGLVESLQMLRDVLRRDQYEGVFGFSQGGALAVLLATLLENPHSYPAFLVDGQPPHPPFRFCVAISAFKIDHPVARQIYGRSYVTPTLHVFGKTDVVVAEEQSKLLLGMSANAKVEEHAGGHFIPPKASSWRTFLPDHLGHSLGDMQAPGSRGVSQTSSSSKNTRSSLANPPRVFDILAN